jgi:hypothetical protein
VYISLFRNITFLQCVIVTHRRQQGFYFPPLVGFLRLSQVILSRCERVRAGLCPDEVRPTCHLATDVGLPAAHRHETQSLASVRWLLFSTTRRQVLHLLAQTLQGPLQVYHLGLHPGPQPGHQLGLDLAPMIVAGAVTVI